MSNKEKLILAGFKVLKQKGNDDFSLREISRECQLSHNTPYKHFANKEEFIKEMALIALNSLENKLDLEKVKDLTVSNKVKYICINYLNYFIENPEHILFFFKYGEVVVFNNKTIKSSQKHNFTKIKKLLNNSYPDTFIAEKRALMLWNFTHGLTTMLIQKKIEFSSTIELNDYIDESIDLILR